jgi:hypothetical protein
MQYEKVKHEDDDEEEDKGTDTKQPLQRKRSVHETVGW